MRTNFTLILLGVLIALSVSCSKKEPVRENEKQMESLYGLYLGEPKSELFDRATGKASWSQLPGNKWDYRGELFRFSGPLDETEGIDFLRIAFFEDRLFEIVAYYSDTSRTMLHILKREIEGRYGGTIVAPDGTVEMAYKT